MTSSKKEEPIIRKLIYDPPLDIFRFDESYDIRQVITNKKDKFDVRSANASNFPTYFMKAKKLSPIMFYAKVMVAWVSIASWFSFFLILGICAQTYQQYLFSINVIWGIFSLPLIFTILWILMYFIPFATFHSWNKKYLQNLKNLFIEMQQKGYIEKDLSKYPESLQMAFWQYHWYDWHKDLNHYIRHWSWYDGFLALEYFFYAYSCQSFPLDENAKWISWFNQFASSYYMCDRIIYYTFHPDTLTYHPDS